MLLYHGSPFSFDEPNPNRGKSYRDFGVGFYLAENDIDSISIALKDSHDGYVYTYEVDDAKLLSTVKYLEFDSFTDECLRFIYDNRMGNTVPQYDVIIGPTAGDKVNLLFNEYRKTKPSFSDVIGTMRRDITDTKFGFQWCFTNEYPLSFLNLVDKEHVYRD